MAANGTVNPLLLAGIVGVACLVTFSRSGDNPWAARGFVVYLILVCNDATTGRNGCRSYILADFIKGEKHPTGGYRYSWTKDWLFNNMVRFRTW